MKKIKITQFQDGKAQKKDDVVAEERIVHIDINSEVSFDVIFTPDEIKNFVYGNLYTEGFIKNIDEVLKYDEKIKENIVFVEVKLKDFTNRKRFFKKNYNIVWTECGSASELARQRHTDQFRPLNNKMRIQNNDLLNISAEIKPKIDLFKQTGAFHYAFLFDENIKLQSYAYDIGRHNAVDKLVGNQILSGGALEDKVIYITGRISSDIIFKCLRAKIPVIISRGAPFETSIELGKKYNMCIIGFLRGKRFNVYSRPEVII